jgi:uncharacterized lipoprotein YmbA
MKTHARPASKLLATLSLLAACNVLQARRDPTQYFVLTSDEHEAAVAPGALVVGLDHVELPEYLRRPELVTRLASNELAIAEYQHWAEPLEVGLARTLRLDLKTALRDCQVVAPPFDPARPPDVIVDVEVRRFERAVGQGAVLDASWTVRDRSSPEVVASHESHVRQPIAGEDSRTTVAALSGASAALAREIATAIRHPSASR